jgi:chemotaxis protein CheX
MENVHPQDIAEGVLTATREVFSTMLNLPAEPDSARQEAAAPSTFDGVIALVGIAGTWTGTGRISCSSHLACQIAGGLLMTEFTAVDEEVLDAMAEMTNMIIGNVKTILEERLGPLALSTPTVIFGRNFKTRSTGVLEWTMIPFRCGDEVMEVRFSLMPTNQMAHPLLRPEVFHV